jgi:hypothetical protein
MILMNLINKIRTRSTQTILALCSAMFGKNDLADFNKKVRLSLVLYHLP